MANSESEKSSIRGLLGSDPEAESRFVPDSKRKWATLILRWLVAAAFVAAALAKLMNVPELVAVYDKIGVGQWFRYFTVFVEIVGVIAVLIPRYTALGALLLAMTMFVAALTCVFILASSPVPALFLCCLCAVLFSLTRGHLAIPR